MKAYNIFIQTYEPQKWIDEQKLLLKAKYIEAKQLGETANNYRNIISKFYFYNTIYIISYNINFTKKIIFSI